VLSIGDRDHGDLRPVRLWSRQSAHAAGLSRKSRRRLSWWSSGRPVGGRPEGSPGQSHGQSLRWHRLKVLLECLLQRAPEVTGELSTGGDFLLKNLFVAAHRGSQTNASQLYESRSAQWSAKSLRTMAHTGPPTTGPWATRPCATGASGWIWCETGCSGCWQAAPVLGHLRAARSALAQGEVQWC
jgi:hypothetical protein